MNIFFFFLEWLRHILPAINIKKNTNTLVKNYPHFPCHKKINIISKYPNTSTIMILPLHSTSLSLSLSPPTLSLSHSLTLVKIVRARRKRNRADIGKPARYTRDLRNSIWKSPAASFYTVRLNSRALHAFRRCALA